MKLRAPFALLLGTAAAIAAPAAASAQSAALGFGAAPAPAVTRVDLPPSEVREAATAAALAVVPQAPSVEAPRTFAQPSYAPPAYSSPVYAAPSVGATSPVAPTQGFTPAAARVPATAPHYRTIFAALRRGDWYGASALLDATLPGPLHAVARAEIYLAKGSPRVEAGPLLALVEGAPDLPQAAQLAALARTRGAQYLPALPVEQRMIFLTPSPRRERARSVEGDAASNALRGLAEPLIKNDRPAELELLLTTREPYLTPEARTEWQQRTAWTYYTAGNYAGARRLAERAGVGAGEWAVQGDWVLGLAAWRMADCAAASDAFGRVASRARDSDLSAAGHYWASRADLQCQRPERVQARLRGAARLSETFYGLLAGATLGIKAPPAPRAPMSGALATRPNVVAATMLAEIGEPRLADALIRHQARLTGRSDHGGLLELAARLSLPSTQYWLAHNGPSGVYVRPEDRYPAPRYNPSRGWRVDKALVFAHTLQESNFRTAVVSPAGATGLMQVRPGTAGDIARARGEYFSTDQLTDPSYNIEYGQSYLEQLSNRGATGGLLPKVIAAYNAGPVPVERWNLSVRDGGDPLLWIESLPYWETRGYVPTILRNYWVYQRSAGEPSPSLTALSQGKWPVFPTAGNRVAKGVEAGQVRLNR